MTPLGLARRFKLAVEFADLGAWSPRVQLHSEYDPQRSVARVNQRVCGQLAEPERARFVACAVAHELYHHLARLRRNANRRAEEAAAQRFAERLVRRTTGDW